MRRKGCVIYMEFSKLSAPSLKDLFVQQLQGMILSGELPMGAQLPPERELARQMQVSRAVVNGGLAELAKQGFLEVRPDETLLFVQACEWPEEIDLRGVTGWYWTAEEEPEEKPQIRETGGGAPAVPSRTPVVAPLSGETVAVFSMEQLAYDATLGDWRTHNGVDIQAAAGTEVVATAAGTVLSVEEDGRLGVTVVIDHADGYVTTYASLHPEVAVLAGDSVSAGTVIGAVGNTSLSEAGLGAHLHFSVTKNGEAVDPAAYLA